MVTMPAVKLYRGDTWQRAWVIEQPAGVPLDLTGATARLHVRDGAGQLVMDASVANGWLSIQPGDGRIDLLMPKEATGIVPGSYRFDLEITLANGIRKTVEQDALLVIEDMTRD